MGKIFLIIFIILVSFLILGSTSNEKAPESNSPQVAPVPSPSDYPIPTIKTSRTVDNKTLIEVVEHKIKVKIPKGWSYSLYKDTVSYLHVNGIGQAYRGVLLLQNADNSTHISLVPNFQGDYCSGARDIKQEKLPDRFGLVGKKTTCKDSYYVYGETVPNLFIPITGKEDVSVKEILTSVEYIPSE